MPSEPKATGSSVANQCKLGGFERLEAEADHHRTRDGHRRAEARAALDEGAEGKGNEKRLDAAIPREARDLALQDLELSGLDRDLIDEDRVQHDPADGEQSERRAIGSCCDREIPRHVIHGDGDDHGDQQARERRKMCPHMPEGKQTKQGDDGQRRDEGGEREIAQGA